MNRYFNVDIDKEIDKPNPKTFTKTIRFPKIPLDFSDIYVYSQQGDRFDILAEKYYGDSSLWWIISLANPKLKQDSYYPPIGIQLRIPTIVVNIVNDYVKLNSEV